MKNAPLSILNRHYKPFHHGWHSCNTTVASLSLTIPLIISNAGRAEKKMTLTLSLSPLINKNRSHLAYSCAFTAEKNTCVKNGRKKDLIFLSLMLESTYESSPNLSPQPTLSIRGRLFCANRLNGKDLHPLKIGIQISYEKINDVRHPRKLIPLTMFYLTVK